MKYKYNIVITCSPSHIESPPTSVSVRQKVDGDDWETLPCLPLSFSSQNGDWFLKGCLVVGIEHLNRACICIYDIGYVAILITYDDT